MKIFGFSSLGNDLSSRIEMAGARVVEYAQTLSEKEITDEVEAGRDKSVESQAGSLDSKDLEDVQWRKFSVAADIHLRNWIDLIKENVIKSLPSELTSELSAIDKWLDLWQLKKLYSDMGSLLDIENKRHGEDSDPRCPVDLLGGGDKQILDLVSFDIMNLYDPCVVKRLWKADMTSDQSFFEALSDTIKMYAHGPTKSQAKAERRFYLVTSVLCEMHRVGLVDLVSGAKNAENDEDWEFARQTIRYFLTECPDLLKKRYFQKKEFGEKFAPEFDSTKMPDTPLVKYKYPNSFPRFRLREWIHLK